MDHHILVVDDAPDWREMLAGLIADVYPMFTVITVASLEEAKRQLARYKFELAIIDIRLDESDEDNTDGLDLTEYIKVNYNEIRVLIITSYANLDTVKRALQPTPSGLRLAADYVEKDKLTYELLPRISAILGESATDA